MGILDGAFFLHMLPGGLSHSERQPCAVTLSCGEGFSKTITLQGYKGWMKSKGVANIMLRPKIAFGGRSQ